MPLNPGNRNRGPLHNRHIHGMAGSPTYKSWSGMKRRCLKEGSKDYHNYGGRGISFCDRWQSFAAFFGDMGVCPPGYTLEREDNDGHYGPDNCRWAGRDEQNRNRRFVTRARERAAEIIVDRQNGMSLKDISEKHGVSVSRACEITKQQTAYLDAVHRHFSEQGVALTDPGDLLAPVFNEPERDAA